MSLMPLVPSVLIGELVSAQQCKICNPVAGSEQSGDREVQRTMLELLNQLDGFEVKDDIKVRQYRHKTALILKVFSMFRSLLLQIVKTH